MSLVAESGTTLPFRSVCLRDARFWCLSAAILVYAFWSTPTPGRAGWAELAIGLLLVAATGLPRAAQAFRLDLHGGMRWERAGRFLLLYGLTVPVICGVLAGNAPGAMARDIVPFLFLLLPLFITPGWKGREALGLTALVMALGLIFSLRVLLPAWGTHFAPGALPDPDRLANAPTVLLAALLLAGLGGLRLYAEKFLSGAALLALSAVPLLTMGLVGQRASIGVFCLVGLMLAAIGLWRAPRRMVLSLVTAAGLFSLCWPWAQEIGAALVRKNTAVGLNMRWQEAAAVMNALGGSAAWVIFGKGWGASIASPAVGGAVVNFTHSLLTTYWLKTGLIGLALALFYLGRLGLLLVPLLYRYPVMALALAGPFAIDVSLYASFKSLDFGLVLLLVPLWAEKCRRAQSSL